MPIDGTAIKEIKRLAEQAVEPKQIDIDGRKYTTGNLSLMREPAEDEPTAIEIGTLTGLVEYVNNSIDLKEGVKGEQLHVIVSNHEKVKVSTSLFGDRQQRADYAICVARGLSKNKPFNTYISLEAAIVFLKTAFVENEDLLETVEFLSKVKTKSNVTTEDNGTSQMVEIKSGIARSSQKDVKSPICLKPYRTFAEIEQPEGFYVVRVKLIDGEVCVAFFASDSPVWMIEAATSISEFLKAGIKREHTIVIS